MKYVLALIALALINSPLFAETPDCAALYEEHKNSDLTLSYKKFDQTMGSGFRVLAGAGCQKEAADLIEEYIDVNDAKQSSLRWHIAQLRAGHGDYAAAIEYAHTVLLEEEDFSERPLRWNDYVLASIAFWEKDKEALVTHRDRVEEGLEEHPGNELNLRLLDALIKHFD